MIKVLIVDDSTTARDAIAMALEERGTMKIIGQACNGEEAVRMVKDLRPDVITMDIRMPKMDGMEATRIIMQEAATPIVLVSSHLDEEEAENSIKAMELGALALRRKLPGVDDMFFDDESENLARAVEAMAGVKVVSRTGHKDASHQKTVHHSPQKISSKPALVAIAASTGGPQALVKIFARLGPKFDVPILLTQHLGEGFAEGYLRWLTNVARVPAKIVSNGESLKPGTLYVAPEDQHFGITPSICAKLSYSMPIHGFRPSADYMFDSVGKCMGSRALAVILSGMGEDGVAGLQTVKDNGGKVIAQNEESSVIFGMPGVAIERGLSDAELSSDDIGKCLAEVICS